MVGTNLGIKNKNLRSKSSDSNINEKVKNPNNLEINKVVRYSYSEVPLFICQSLIPIVIKKKKRRRKF